MSDYGRLILEEMEKGNGLRPLPPSQTEEELEHIRREQEKDLTYYYQLNQSKNQADNNTKNSDTSSIPIWEKYTLTVDEAAEYFRIGRNKLRKIISENEDADFILWNGTRPQIKRKKFENYIDKIYVI